MSVKLTEEQEHAIARKKYELFTRCTQPERLTLNYSELPEMVKQAWITDIYVTENCINDIKSGPNELG